MIKLTGKFETLAPAFGGQIFRVGVEDLDSFYLENVAMFSSHGRRAFIQSMGIPPGFFDQQPKPLQSDILTSQKVNIRKKSKGVLLVADSSNTLQFAAADSEKGRISPEEMMGLTVENNWTMVKQDYARGTFRYFSAPSELSLTEYTPVVYVNVPVFYTKPMSVELGMFKLKCKNGMVDRVNSGSFSMKPNEFRRSVFDAMFAGMRSALVEVEPGLQDFVKHMKAKAVTVKDGVDLMGELITRGDVVPKTLINYCYQHFDRINDKKEIEEAAPQAISTEYDLMDTMTFHANRLGSVSGQTKAQSGIFALFLKRASERGFRLKAGVSVAAIGKKFASPLKVG